MNPPTVIVLQAYGATININQNIFCLLSLLRHLPVSSAATVAIYTDQSDLFRQFFGPDERLQYFDLSPERVKEWRGATNFVHRVKVEMIRDIAKLNPTKNIFYVDGDTLFLKDPSPLFSQIDDQTTIMHELENVIGAGRDPISKKVAKFLRAEVFTIDGHEQKISTEIAMWNAGVIGFSPKFFARLNDVLKLTEDMHSRFQKHVMEQLAFSYYLQKQTYIRPAGEYVLHYWRQKDLYNELIAQFLNANPYFAKARDQFEQIKFPPPPRLKKHGFAKVTDFFSKLTTRHSSPT